MSSGEPTPVTIQGFKLIKILFGFTYFWGARPWSHFFLRFSASLHTKNWKLISSLHKIQEGWGKVWQRCDRDRWLSQGNVSAINVGAHPQAPENLVPKKINASCNARGVCSARCSGFPFAPPVNYSFEESQPIIMDVQTHFSLNGTWLTVEFYWNNFQTNKLWNLKGILNSIK